jgi:hypothetical protein
MPVFKRSPKQPGVPVFRAPCPVVDDEAITLLDECKGDFSGMRE